MENRGNNAAEHERYLTALRTPLADDAPAGVDLTQTDRDRWLDLKGSFERAIEREREEWDAQSSTGESSTTGPRQNGLDERTLDQQWGDIAAQAAKILSTESRDMRIARFLIEAKWRIADWEGLAEGADIALVLLSDYRDQFHPLKAQAIGGQMLAFPERIVALADLAASNGNFTRRFYRTPLAGGKSYTELVEKDRSSTDDDAPAEDIKSKAKDTFERLTAARQRWDAVEKKIDSPGMLKQVFDAFSNIKTKLGKLGDISVAASEQHSPSSSSEGVGDTASPTWTETLSGWPELRSRLLCQVETIAGAFEKADPLSLTAKQLKLAVDMAREPPEKFYSRMVERDESTRKNFEKIIGLRIE